LDPLVLSVRSFGHLRALRILKRAGIGHQDADAVADRGGGPLAAKEKHIHDRDLVAVLRQIHDELDAAVLEAFGWSDLKGSVGVPPP
jgi:hypothetical protein